MADSTPLAQLKIIVAAESDIARFADNESLLNYALSFAASEIIKRRNPNAPLEDQYIPNQVEGAKWYLSRMGTEGVASISENGEKTEYSKVPDWLSSVVPRLGVVRRA